MNRTVVKHHPPARRDSRSYLYVGLAVSLAVHASLLAVRFRAPDASPRARASSLEVVLLNARTESAPVDALVLAQTDFDGGGDHEAGIARSPLPPSPTQESFIDAAAARARQAQMEARQRELMTRLRAPYSHAEASAPVDAGQARPAATTPPLRPGDQQALAQLAQQFAAVSQRVHDYNQRPRRHYFAPSASAAPFAEYVETWRERIESVGNEHYPAQARGRLYGSLRMTVFVRADGSVENIEIDEPSEHSELNAAARDIVRYAAPFAPFPAAVRRSTDVIAITRTWHFENDAISTEDF